ncbi:MAG: hypothetical protein ACPG4T_21725, partial [Nannocystaceae bacterium]
LLAGTVVLESAMALGRFQRRKQVFDQAMKRSVKTERPLVVVGDPNAGLHTRLVAAYGCGDVCVDLTGCPACPVAKSADITSGIKGLEDDSSVVFCCCVLEYVSDVAAAMQELKRIAGADDNLFLVFVDRLSLTGYLYPGGQRVALDERGASWRQVSWRQRAVVGGLLLGTLFAAVK